MGQERILRLDEGVNLTEQQRQTLKKTLGEFTVERSRRGDFRRSHQRRIDSLEKAFEFVRKAIPPRKAFNFVHFQSLCKHEWPIEQKHGFDECAKILSNFKTAYVDVIMSSWGLGKHEAQELLNRAEQYVLVKEGRKDIATISLIRAEDSSKPHYALQMETGQSPFTEETLKELENIKKTNYKETPEWFAERPIEQQIYFYYAPAHKTSLASFDTDITGLITECKIHRQDIEDFISGKRSEWLQKLPPYHKHTMEYLASASKLKSGESLINSLETIKSSIAELQRNITLGKTRNFISELSHVRETPYWYSRLPAWEQKLLVKTLSEMKNIREEMHFLPSRLRSLPGMANFAKNDFLLLNEKMETEQQFPSRYHSSHIASRDVKEQPSIIGNTHSGRNFSTIWEKAQSEGKKNILIQTLISPSWLAELATYYFSKKGALPDAYLYTQLDESMKLSEQKIGCFQTNHPFNMANKLNPTASSDPKCKAFYIAASNLKNKSHELQSLLKIYDEVLNSGLGSATVLDYNGRELWLSTLESLIISTPEMEGIDYGSCVSGKDRKAVQNIHTRAFETYKHLYGEWPAFYDTGEKRKRFVILCAKLYLSGHWQENAGQNAPGADGTKTPENYWPRDISDMIKILSGNNSLLKEDDKLATYNEVDAIKNAPILDSVNWDFVNDILSRIESQKLEQIMRDISAIVKENKTWQQNTSVSTGFFTETAPTGVQKLRELLESKEMYGNSVILRLAAVIETACNRVNRPNYLRHGVTQNFYNAIEKLRKINSNTIENDTNNILRMLEDIKKKTNVSSYEPHLQQSTCSNQTYSNESPPRVPTF